MMGVKSKSYCRELFKRLQILTFPCEYIYSLTNFITNNEELFEMNADVHSVNTRHKHYLHKPIVNLSCFQKGANYAGIRIFNGLPSDLKGLIHKYRGSIGTTVNECHMCHMEHGLKLVFHTESLKEGG
jgi:hypothetical protein